MLTTRRKKVPDIVLDIDIATEYPGWEHCGFAVHGVIEQAIHAAVENSAHADSLQNQEAEVSVVLCNDEFIRQLNRDYRGKDKATNVLSFPQTDFCDKSALISPVPFGDIILAYETIAREAEEQNKLLENHFAHLVVHGTLHLLGYDHEQPEEAETMESIEISVLEQMGIENPYS